MAVPKSKASKSKRNSRLAKWKGKSTNLALQALSLAKSALTGKGKFILSPRGSGKKVKTF
uniref:50S ribosomal protein L32 n=1 Tax=Microzonia abyssicola TaxID=217214 RepID=UPI002E770110|nr:50S ribosomal protein L32 [Syringoderma abyssicola]WAM65055.1 50S ribosomal protein L32 [Syringoderma abyssicola]